MSAITGPLALRVLAVVLPALAVTGCGSGSAPTSKDPQHIVTSATDCADNAGLDYETCVGMIEKAVAEHSKSAASYSSLAACEKKEGTDRCERLEEKTYRPRLMAFRLTLGKHVLAEPLYPTAKGEAGFRDPGSKVIKTDDESVKFTQSAIHAAELFMKETKKTKAF